MEHVNSRKIDLVWGCEAIAAVIGRTPRQTFHMLDNGLLPAKKVGRKWVADRHKLGRFFLDEDRAQEIVSGS